MQGTSDNEKNEALYHVYFVPDNIWKHIMLLIIFVVICVLIKYKTSNLDGKIERLNYSKIVRGLLAAYIIIGMGYVFITQLKPATDQWHLIKIAEEMHQGNFSGFLQEGYLNDEGMTEGYMYLYPHQSGFLLLIYYVMYIFGNNTYLVVQFLNVIATGISFYFLYKIIAVVWQKNSILYILMEMAFLPLLLYMTFIYGNTLSFAAAVCAIYLEYCFFYNPKLQYAIISAMLISLSTIWKSNSLIILSAMILLAIYIICKLNEKQRLKAVIYVACLILFYVGGNKLVEVHMESIIGMELPNGIPKIAWVAMGLEEAPEGPGWYNGNHANVYRDSNYDSEVAKEECIKTIEIKLKKWTKDYRIMFEFMGRKIAGQWNDPTFESLKISRDRASMVGLSRWINSIYEGRGSIYLKEIMNLYQTWILFGVCAYIIICFKKIRLSELLFAVIMLGGFVFHLFWEAKSQYVIFYFFLMIPYAFIGYQTMINKLYNLLQKVRIGALHFNAKRIGLGCLVIIFCIGLLIPLGRRVASMKVYQYTLGVRSSDELLQEYMAEQDQKGR